MANYINYPAVDETYHFPPEIVSALMQDVSFFQGYILSSRPFDDIITPGFYTYYANHPDAPGEDSGHLLVIPMMINTTNITGYSQLAFTYGGVNKSYKRYKGSGGWASWTQTDPSTIPTFRRENIPVAELVDGKKPDIREYLYGSGKEGQYASLAGTITGSYSGLPDELAASPEGFTAIVTTLGAGVIISIQTYSVWGIKVYYTSSASSGAIGWVGWREVQWVGDDEESTAASTSSSGFKTIAYPLTAGRGGTVKGAASATLDFNIDLSPDVHVNRFRFALGDGNPLYNSKTANGVTITNRKVNGGFTGGTLVKPATEDIYFSPWMNVNMGPNGFQTFGFTYAADQGPSLLAGGGKINGVQGSSMPFELWLELEVPSGTPTAAIVGDSNGAGVGSTDPMHDSWLAIYARKNGIIPVNYSHSGDSLANSENPDHYKWNRWNHLDKPDVVIHTLGPNDFSADGGMVTLDEMKRRNEAVWAIADEKITPNKHVGLIKSRGSILGTSDTVRKQINNWFRTLPDGLRDFHDISAPVTTGDANGVRPEYLSSDGIHMNTAGQIAIANSITKVVSIPGGLVFNEKIGKTITAWDPINKKMALVAGDTGERDITALSANITTGKVFLRREGNLVTMTLDGVALGNASGTSYDMFASYSIPLGFRPSRTNWYGFLDGPPSSRRVGVSSSGWVPVYLSPSPSDYYRGIMNWTTDNAWPTTLPGNPA